MSTLALQLKSHSSRLEACKAIVHEIQSGNLTNEKREELFQALKEPWVEQHDAVAKLSYYSILSHFPEFLKSNYYILFNDLKPFMLQHYTHKQLPVFRNAAVVVCIEIIRTLVKHCNWRESEVDAKIITPYLKNIIDKTAAQFDLISAVRVGLCFFELGFQQLITKHFGSQVTRNLDLVLNENLIKKLIKDSIMRLSCDPLLKQVVVILSQLEKQNEVSKKMWKAFFQLGESKNMAYRALFFEVVVSFIVYNQNKRIFIKTLKTKAMRHLVDSMDQDTVHTPYYASLIDRLSKAFATTTRNPRFRKIIFPSAEEYRDDIADISKMVIYALGASDKIFDYIPELPQPFPEAFLLNINNVETQAITEEFFKGLFDFAFIQTLSEEDFEELENGAVADDGTTPALDEGEDDVPIADATEEGEADDDFFLSDLITDQDAILERAQEIFLSTVNRCATWHHASAISPVVDHYKSKLNLDETSREVLQTVFPEAESKIRDALFALREKLSSMTFTDEEKSDQRLALKFFIESLLLHQLYVPSLLTEDSHVVDDLDNFIAVVLEGKEVDKEVNPVEVLMDLTLQLVTIDNLLSPAAAFCLKYFLRGHINEEIINMILSVVQPALSSEEGDEVVETGMMVPEDVMEEDEAAQGADPSLMGLQDNMDVSDSEEQDLANGAETNEETAVNAVSNGADTEEFDQDEYMFQHDDAIRMMFLQRKRDLDRQKSALSLAQESSFTAASSVLQLVETFVRHTHRAHDALLLFNTLLRTYVRRLKQGTPKRFAAKTHQKLLHVLSVIYKTPLNLNQQPEERKKTKGTTHKYYGRVDSLVDSLVATLMELLSHTHIVPNAQLTPILLFFQDIFTTHPDKSELILPPLEKVLKGKILSRTKFTASKAASFLVAVPWMSEFFGTLIVPLVKRFAKGGNSVFHFLDTCLNRNWDVFAQKGSFDQFIAATLKALQKDLKARREKVRANKKLFLLVKNVLIRYWRKYSGSLSESTTANMKEIATLMHEIRPAIAWAPILPSEPKRRKRKRTERKEEEQEAVEEDASKKEKKQETTHKKKKGKRSKKRQKKA